MTILQEVGGAARDRRAKPGIARASDGFERRSKTGLFDRRGANNPRMDLLRLALDMNHGGCSS